MRPLQERHRVGVEYLEAATVLLQRARGQHPTVGLYEAADLQWWWHTPRPTDDIAQLFWYDERGRPEAAVIATDWGERVALDPIVMPGADARWITHVMQRGLAHAAACGLGPIGLEVDRSDHVLREVLVARGFTNQDEAMVEAWLASAARPEVSSLHDGYRLCTRSDAAERAHHMIERSGANVETRLRQTSLYRADLDLLVLDRDDHTAAYGLFWFDPVTRTGLVEPMRTADEHQRRGLARHVLTAGVNLLIEAGARRIKIVFDADNHPARDLYLDVGFESVKETMMFSGQALDSPDRAV